MDEKSFPGSSFDFRPLITNDRAAREWYWLLHNVRAERLQEACNKLGGSQVFPMNIARGAGVKLPPQDQLPPVPLSAEERDKSIQISRKKIRALRETLDVKAWHSASS